MTKKVIITDKAQCLIIPEPYMIDVKKKRIIENEMRLIPPKREDNISPISDKTVIVIDL